MKMSMLLVVAAWGLTIPAQALTVTNRDQDTTTVTLIANGEEQSYELEPGETLSDVCEAGCIGIFGVGEEVEMTGTETVIIENDRPKIQASQ